MSIFRNLPSRRYAVAVVLALATLSACSAFDPVVQTVVKATITPWSSFEEYVAPPAPDYAKDAAWLSLPGIEDAADRSPAGLDLDRQASAPADVFFIHPTTYVTRKGWNQPLDDEAANDELKAWVLPAQAGAFNGCCRVYVPRYRQATIAAFFDKTGSGEKALDLAYRDVERAFEAFLRRSKGRPFILAGHSQGARHAQRLLAERITPEIIEKQLVAAYTIGQPLRAETLPACESATQTRCQISWNSQTRFAARSIGQPWGLCVNPLTWTTNDEKAPASANAGSVDFGATAKVERNVVGAQCREGLLLLGNPNTDNFRKIPFGPGNYHRYEFSLYHMNIRSNARARVAAFLDR